MQDHDKKTQETILNAAKTVFVKKGFDGARMQEIADEAGINKALLHYYFRNKEKLFDAVFSEAFSKLLPDFKIIFQSEIPLEQKIEKLARSYITLISENPYIPLFILHELNRAPSRVADLMLGLGIRPQQVAEVFNKQLAQGNYVDMDAKHLIVNMIALSVFPFAARPLISKLLFGENAEGYDQFLHERLDEVPKFITNAILKK